jgi:hypothetical protein
MRWVARGCARQCSDGRIEIIQAPQPAELNRQLSSIAVIPKHGPLDMPIGFNRPKRDDHWISLRPLLPTPVTDWQNWV